MLKVVRACYACPNMCVTSSGECNWASVVSQDALPCPLSFRVMYNRSQWSNYCRWSFDFFFIFSLLICNVQHCLLCFLLFNFSPHSINFLFHSISIYTSFYFSQFSHSIAISHMFGFSFRSSFFNISNFILGTFIEFFFQFHPPIKFSVIIIIILF